ncbi:MAG: winged helix-turn-helix domain-containing protein [Xanthomonadales bacterium]|nr:winged helix-turn-helix domain-containing protein [Xanthomonadales bacterium]
MTQENQQNRSNRIVLGSWHYWSDSGQLKNKSIEQNLPTQLNAVLTLLIEKFPSVVTREEFLSSVWADKVVNEDALSRTIAELRKILGDSASQAKYIKTIPKKGYKLVIEPITFNTHKKSYIHKTVFFLLAASLLTIYGLSTKESMVSKLTHAIANAQRITAKPGMEQQTQSSDDGLWMSYVTNTIDESYVTIQSTIDQNKYHQIEMTGHRLASPVFDAAAKVIWFLAYKDKKCYLMSKDLNNSQNQRWSECVFEIESRTLSADFVNKKIYFSQLNSDNRTAIHELDIQTGQVVMITEAQSTSAHDWSPNISPDFQMLSFSRGNQSVRNLWLKNLSTGEEKALTFGEHYSVSHDWLDSRYIVYDSDRSGSRQLWLLDLNNLRTYAIGGYGAQHPSFDEKGQIMTFQKVDYEANIWQHDLLNNQVQRLVHSTKYDNNPAFSPSGDLFAFSSNRQDVGSIWLYDFKLQQENLLLVLPNVKLTRPSWLSGGRNLLVTANDENGYWTLRYDLNTQTHQKIPFSMNNLAAIEHDGKIYALAKSTSVSHQILVLDQGVETLLPLKNISRFMILNDGQLVYTKNHKPGIYISDVKQNKETVLIKNFPNNAINLWTAVNQAVYYDVSGKDAGIYRLDVQSGQSKKVSDQRPFSVGTSLSVNQAETIILLTKTDRAESDVFRASIKSHD